MYESCATLSPDGYLIQWHIATYKKWIIFPCKESLKRVHNFSLNFSVYSKVDQMAGLNVSVKYSTTHHLQRYSQSRRPAAGTTSETVPLFTASRFFRNCTRQSRERLCRSFVNSAVTALFTKLPTSRSLAIPWFDWYYSIIPPFHPWSCQWGNGPWASFLLVCESTIRPLQTVLPLRV